MREEMQDNPSLNDQDVQQDLQPNQKEKSSENKSLSRRRLLKNTTAAGAATLAVGGGFALAKSSILLTPAQASSDPNTFNLPLNIQGTSDFELFLRALGDEKVRAGLNKEQDTLPPNARQLLLMIDDQQFMAKGMAVSTHFTNFLHGKESLEHFNTYAQDFSNYMITKYPVGYAALRDFAIKMHPQFTENEKILKEQVTKVLQGDPVGSATNPVNEKVNATLSPNDCPTSVACAAVVAANALVVVNTVVYTNVAGATLVAVAAAAAICAAVVVCPAVSTDIAVSAAGNF